MRDYRSHACKLLLVFLCYLTASLFNHMKSTRGARHTREAAAGVKAKAKEAASSTSHVQEAVRRISEGEESTRRRC